MTTLSNGDIVLILDIKELLGALGESRGVARRQLLPALEAEAAAFA